jgi:hypothetical protein
VRLSGSDWQAVRLWAGWRLAVAVLGAATGGLLFAGKPGYGWSDRWYHWDVVHYVGIAQNGYTGEPTGVPNEAFLPGLPLLMRAGATLGLSEVAVGVAVSAFASLVAAVALARLAERAIPGSSGLTVLVWFLAPTSLFLAAPYTEALFLALALPAWLAAQDRRWLLAGVLVAAASTVRVSAVFLTLALGVLWFTQRPRRGRDLPFLLLPLLPLAAIVVVQHAATGSWTAWLDAQRSPEWSRSARVPWETAENTWEAAFAGSVDALYAWPFRLEIVAMVAGVLTVGWCLRRRWWPEATYVAASVLALAFSYWYLSVPRAALLWWPLWIGIAVLLTDRPWLRTVWLAVSGSLAAAWAIAFFTGGWAG